MHEAMIVTDSVELDTAVARLRDAPRLALDTEFMRERTYYPQLCLIQIASDSDCFLVDPLAGVQLDALFEVLTDRNKLKILHAARQDLEVLLQSDQRGAAAALAVPVFDTQSAAALLGLAPQLGYAELVARRLGHSIDKGQTRTDWARRPLSPAQLAYAADDVRHLLELHTELERDLQNQGRADWLREDMTSIERISLYRTEPGDAWRRLKGLGRLRPRERALGRALAGWREQRAITCDRPRGWILADEALFAIATQQPRSTADLESIRSLPPAIIRKHGDDLLALVNSTLNSPLGDEADTPATRPDASTLARAAAMSQIVRDEAARLQITPELLATRRDIEALAQGRTEVDVLRGWRRTIVGEQLLALLPDPGYRVPQSAR
jgi:ribonuclease D